MAAADPESIRTGQDGRMIFQRGRGPREEGAGRDRSESDDEDEGWVEVPMLREAEADADAREMGRENRVWAEKDANGWLLSLGRIPEPENVESGRGCARADDRRRPATIAAVPRAADRIPCPKLQNWRAWRI